MTVDSLEKQMLERYGKNKNAQHEVWHDKGCMVRNYATNSCECRFSNLEELIRLKKVDNDRSNECDKI